MPRASDIRLGNKLVIAGHISREDLTGGLSAVEDGERYRNLAQYLFESGLVDAATLRETLASSYDVFLRCDGCDKRFGIPKYDQRKSYTCGKCGGNLVPPVEKRRDSGEDPLTGQKLAHFEIIEPLGRGGMARVYRARDTRLGRTVALKVLPAARMGESSTTLARFMREARAVAHLNDPTIVTLYDVGEIDGVRFIAMEYVDGQSLWTIVKKNKPLTPRAAAQVVARVARGLAFAHERGIVHRDIKPSNIMITKSGNVKITDFGLARVIDDRIHITLPGTAIGTPAYMSPEQCRGEAADARSDIYSLGITFFFLLKGRVPYEGSSLNILQRHADGEPISVSTEEEPIPEPVALVAKKMLDKNYGARYQTAAEVAEDLERVLHGEDPVLPGIFEFMDDPPPPPDDAPTLLVPAPTVAAVQEEELSAARRAIVRRLVFAGAAAVIFIALFIGISRSLGRGDADERQLVIREIDAIEQEIDAADSAETFESIEGRLTEMADGASGEDLRALDHLGELLAARREYLAEAEETGDPSLVAQDTE